MKTFEELWDEADATGPGYFRDGYLAALYDLRANGLLKEPEPVEQPRPLIGRRARHKQPCSRCSWEDWEIITKEKLDAGKVYVGRDGDILWSPIDQIEFEDEQEPPCTHEFTFDRVIGWAVTDSKPSIQYERTCCKCREVVE